MQILFPEYIPGVKEDRDQKSTLCSVMCGEHVENPDIYDAERKKINDSPIQRL